MTFWQEFKNISRSDDQRSLRRGVDDRDLFFEYAEIYEPMGTIHLRVLIVAFVNKNGVAE